MYTLIKGQRYRVEAFAFGKHLVLFCDFTYETWTDDGPYLVFTCEAGDAKLRSYPLSMDSIVSVQELDD